MGYQGWGVERHGQRMTGPLIARGKNGELPASLREEPWLRNLSVNVAQ